MYPAASGLATVSRPVWSRCGSQNAKHSGVQLNNIGIAADSPRMNMRGYPRGGMNIHTAVNSSTSKLASAWLFVPADIYLDTEDTNTPDVL